MDLLNVLLNLHCLDNWMGTDTCAECCVKFVRACCNSSALAGFHSYLCGYRGNLEG